MISSKITKTIIYIIPREVSTSALNLFANMWLMLNRPPESWLIRCRVLNTTTCWGSTFHTYDEQSLPWT